MLKKSDLSPDLCEVMAAWSDLPDEVKAEVMAMVNAAKEGDDDAE